jgi:hypothetical protein
MKRLHIFKPGSHITMGGQKISFSEEDLKATAAAYDPAKHEAPLVIGHPKADAPAYGWAKEVVFEEGGLHADPDQVDPAFAEMVATGRFKKRSASFYAPDDPRNPVPGVWYLRHVGFLGAQPPAVKGLKAVNFADGDGVTVEFGDWNDRTIARVLRRIKNFWIEKFGKDEADKLIDEWDLESITEEALRPTVPAEPVQPAFAEPPARKEHGMTPEQLQQKEEELKKREAAFAEREDKIRAEERTAQRQKNIAFADKLVSEGKLLPKHKQFAADFMEALDGSQTEVEFSEGKKVAPREAFCQFLEDLGSHPLFKEMVKPAAEFSEPQGGAIPGDLAKHV